MSVDRTQIDAITPDDGTGTTGTAITQAWMGLLMDDVDKGHFVTGEANAFAQFAARGLKLGVGGATALDALLKRSAAARLAVRNVGDSADGDLELANLLASGYVDLDEISTPANPAANVARVYSKDDGGTTKMYFRDSAGTETEIGGAAPLQTYLATLTDVANTAAQTTTLSFTVGANEMADGDFIEVTVTVLVKNNKGTAGTITYDWFWGATTATVISAVSQSNNASERVVEMKFGLHRSGSSLYATPAGTFAVSPYQVALADITGGNTNAALIGTPTFSSSQTVALKITLSAADLTFYYKPQAAVIERRQAAAS